MAPTDPPRVQSPWYREGLCFSCQPDCGACCSNHGSYTYVYLEADELERIAAFLELTPGEFRRRFTTLDDGHRILRMDQPACPFLDGTRCSIYPVRPLQCRTFPFWKENLRSRAAWTKLRRFCPGIDNGERIPRTEIDEQLARHPEE